MALMPLKEFAFVVFVTTILLLGQELESEPTEDKKTLRDFISRVPHMNRLQWNESDSVCSWIGVTCDESESFVTAVRLPGVGFVGPIPANTLGRLTGLRVLSLRSNGLSGEIPYDFINLTFMRNLYLQDNQLSGNFPPFLTRMNRLVRIDISSNNLTGSIPFEINNLTHLTGLLLQNNQLNGSLPTGVPPQLSDFNVSNNGLNGSIPKSLARFSLQSFLGNPGLCGSPLTQCRTFFPSAESPEPAGIKSRGKSRKLSLAAIAAISVGAGLLLLLLLILACLLFFRKRRHQNNEQHPVATRTAPPADAGASSSKDITGASLEGERNKLVFLAAGGFSFDLEDLLRASAEVLGKGTLGTSYKAVLEEGTTVVVKRLRDVNVTKNDFEHQIQILGKIKHPNLVPLRAYYYSKDEKLLVCDYFPDGSLSAMLHGGSGMTAMDWESRKSVARGAARGLAYLHISDLVHGNVKSSNVLLHSRGGAYETRLVDFGVSSLFPSSEPVKRLVEYRAPETMETRKMTKSSDVYSLGVLLLELLTGKSPVIQSAGEALDLPRWVRSVVREEWTAEVFDVEIIRSSPTVEEEMVEMLQIAMACVALVPDQRLRMAEVLRLIDAVGGGAGAEDNDDLRPSDEPSSEGHTPAGTE